MALKSSMRILIVDVDGTMKQIVRKMLGDMGFKNICEALDGQKAWDIISESLEEQKPVEFLITEWDIRKIPAPELVGRIRSHDKLAKLPVLLVTGDSDQSNIIGAIKAGVNNVLVKPFSAQGMMEKISTIFKQ